MRKIVVKNFGTFDISEKGREFLESRGFTFSKTWSSCVEIGAIPRDNRFLVEMVETLKEEANPSSTVSLRVISIPEDVDWIISSNHVGFEWVEEKHRKWI